MNSKKIFISIFVILILILFISSSVFAAVGIKSTITKNPACKTDVKDIKILDLQAIKYPEVTNRGVCGEVLITTNYETYTTDKAFGMGVLIYPSPAANVVTNRDLSRFGLYYMDAIYAGGSGEAGKGVDVGTDTIIAYSPSIANTKIIKLFITKTAICNSPKIDVVIFKPLKLSGMFLQGSQDDTFSCKLINGKLDTWFQTDLAPSGYTSIPLMSSNNWIYNLDYAYDVPVTSGSGTQPTGTITDCSAVKTKFDTTYSTSYDFKTISNPTDSKWNLWTPDQSSSVNGIKDSTCYACAKNSQEVLACKPDGSTSTNNCVKLAYSTLSETYKTALNCSWPSGTKQVVIDEKAAGGDNLTPSETVASSSALKLNTLTSLKNITYNNIPARYVTESNTTITVIGDKTKDKNISITLPDSFKTGSTVYAIFASPTISEKTITEIRNILTTGKFVEINYITQESGLEIKEGDIASNIKGIKFTPTTRKYEFKIPANASTKATIVFMQADGTTLNTAYTHLFVLDDKDQSILYLCEINRRIVSFYCKGYNCGLTPCGCTEPGCVCPYRELPSCISGLGFSNWETGFTGLEDQGTPEIAPPVTPPAVETPPINPPVQTQSTTLEKGKDGCYTSNLTTLAKIRQEGGIGITKTQFSGKRNQDSIVLSTTGGTDDDPSLTIEQIRAVFNRSGTNIPQKVKDASPAFYNLGLLYNVDPIYSLAFFRAEKSLFNQNSGSVTTAIINQNDISGVTVCRCGGTKISGSLYCNYPTIEQGIEAFYLNLEKGTSGNPSIYKNKPFTQVTRTWSGRDDYVTSITGYLADTYTWAGK